jgi:hypothetical protein
MKLSSGKLQFWECKKPPVDAGTFCSPPILVFYILPCWSKTFSVLLQENSVKATN